MISRFSLGPENHDTSDGYRYFTARWVYDRNYFWISDNRSSELALIGGAVFISRCFSTQIFDIRILGAIHALLWIACFAAFLPLLLRLGVRARYAISITALFILTDVSYVAHFNSFYTDTAAFLFLAWALVLWLYLATREGPPAALFALFCLAAILCISSKAQHATLGLLLFLLAVIAAFSFAGKWRKIGALAAALAIPMVTALTFLLVVPSDTEGSSWSVISMKVLNHSPTPLDDARELCLGPEYLRYAVHWPTQPSEHRMSDPAWRAEYNRRTGPQKLARLYLRHPWRALQIIYNDLRGPASTRPWNVGYYERVSGLPPFAPARSFRWWSFLRSALFRLAPWHVLVWYAVVLAMAIRLTVRHRGTMLSRVAILCALLIGMGVTELAISTLGDAGETARHLTLFHIITDFTLLPAIGFIRVHPRPISL